MDQFINPAIYKKESVEINGIFYTGQYYKDDKGRDWYETLTKWSGAISVDENDIVCSYESDVSLMGMAEGRNVFEVNPGDVPDNVVGNFTYLEGVFTDIRPDDIDLANKEKRELMQEANTATVPLQDAIDLGIATDEEVAELNEWKQYRVLLNRVDTSLAPDIEWPVQPS